MSKIFRYSLIVTATLLALVFSALRMSTSSAASEDDFVITLKTDNQACPQHAIHDTNGWRWI